MSTPRNRILLLLVLTMAGWILAPVVHQVGHALAVHELVHAHGELAGLGERCLQDSPEIEDCPICQLHIPAELTVAEMPLGQEPEGALGEAVYRNEPPPVAGWRQTRGPPGLI